MVQKSNQYSCRAIWLAPLHKNVVNLKRKKGVHWRFFYFKLLIRANSMNSTKKFDGSYEFDKINDELCIRFNECVEKHFT